MRIFNSLTALATAALVSAAPQVVPGGTWTASNGTHLNAHGAGVIRVNNIFYLIGEDKSEGSAFKNVNCYSSTDLVEWTYVGALLSRTGSGDLGPNRIIERPKVLYNDKTGKYVMWMHVDSSDYGEAKVGVATGDTVCGKYCKCRTYPGM
jgi:beta-xylosidase